MNEPRAMTPAVFADEVRRIIALDSDDHERTHGLADDLMMLTLRRLGYDQGITLIEGMTRWYA